MLLHIESKIFNKTQSDFRKGHATTTLLLKFRDDIQKAMNANEITLADVIDYSKAFDTIDHTILLLKNLDSKKSQLYPIDDNMSRLKIRYRRHYLYFGVPKGSILGLIQFNLYVAELPGQISFIQSDK